MAEGGGDGSVPPEPGFQTPAQGALGDAGTEQDGGATPPEGQGEREGGNDERAAEEEAMLAMFPDLDEAFVRAELAGGRGLLDLAQRLLDDPAYPRRSARLEREEALARRAALLDPSLFGLADFLRAYPEPEAHFAATDAAVSASYRRHALVALLNEFPGLREDHLTGVLERHNGHFTAAMREVRESEGGQDPREGESSSDRSRPRKRKRRTAGPLYLAEDREARPWPAVVDEAFFRELQFLRHEREIRAAVEERRRTRDAAVARARDAGQLHECAVCAEEVLEEELLPCRRRRHRFCRTCVRRQAETVVGDGGHRVGCLSGDCPPLEAEEPGLDEVEGWEQLLPDHLHQLLDRRRQEAEIREADVEGLETCPFCDFAMVLEGVKDQEFKCQRCKLASCRKCRKPSHFPQSSSEAEEGGVLGYHKAVQEAMAEALIRRCPQCKAAAVKESGCNKIYCRCGANYCYQCGEDISESGYNHFTGRSGFRQRLPRPGTPGYDRLAPEARLGMDQLRAQVGDDDGQGCELQTDDEEAHAERAKKAGEKAKEEYLRKHPELREDEAVKASQPNVDSLVDETRPVAPRPHPADDDWLGPDLDLAGMGGLPPLDFGQRPGLGRAPPLARLAPANDDWMAPLQGFGEPMRHHDYDAFGKGQRLQRGLRQYQQRGRARMAGNVDPARVRQMNEPEVETGPILLDQAEEMDELIHPDISQRPDQRVHFADEASAEAKKRKSAESEAGEGSSSSKRPKQPAESSVELVDVSDDQDQGPEAPAGSSSHVKEASQDKDTSQDKEAKNRDRRSRLTSQQAEVARLSAAVGGEQRKPSPDMPRLQALMRQRDAAAQLLHSLEAKLLRSGTREEELRSPGLAAREELARDLREARGAVEEARRERQRLLRQATRTQVQPSGARHAALRSVDQEHRIQALQGLQAELRARAFHRPHRDLPSLTQQHRRPNNQPGMEGVEPERTREEQRIRILRALEVAMDRQGDGGDQLLIDQVTDLISWLKLRQRPHEDEPFRERLRGILQLTAESRPRTDAGIACRLALARGDLNVMIEAIIRILRGGDEEEPPERAAGPAGEGFAALAHMRRAADAAERLRKAQAAVERVRGALVHPRAPSPTPTSCRPPFAPPPAKRSKDNRTGCSAFKPPSAPKTTASAQEGTQQEERQLVSDEGRAREAVREAERGLAERQRHLQQAQAALAAARDRLQAVAAGRAALEERRRSLRLQESTVELVEEPSETTELPKDLRELVAAKLQEGGEEALRKFLRSKLPKEEEEEAGPSGLTTAPQPQAQRGRASQSSQAGGSGEATAATEVQIKEVVTEEQVEDGNQGHQLDRKSVV